ncbi:MAG: tetratricopeptide repeat protein [Gemmatimonadota bacterium]
MTSRVLLALALACALPAAPAPAAAQHEGHGAAPSRAAADSVPLYDDLGDHHYAITTRVPLAQRYFDQGLRLYYGFNHAEAVRAFEHAARLDPACAMCHWGTALALGPNINAPAMDSAATVQAHAAVQRALRHASGATPREQALIRALAVRYAPSPATPRAGLDSAYARAMEAVAREHPDDAEAATLYAESLMDLSPWHYWTKEGEPRPDTPRILAGLERVIAANPEHPGACHFFIHAVEETQPRRAVPCAERLAALMPGAGHIVHMPGHIYIRVGRYMDAIRANEHAVHADETYIRDQRPGAGIYTLGYYPHNHDFLAFAAMMAGRRDQALEAAKMVADGIPQEALRAPGMEFLQHRMTRPLQLLVRFERWDDVLRAPAPPEDLVHARAMWHYARGRALAARGRPDDAEAELARVRAAAADPALAGVRMEFNAPGPILRVAESVLAGHVAAARGDHAAAAAHLREAARREDELVYGEPPDWTVPVRQELGEALLAAGRPAEAERAFREELEHFPDNGWSLRGLARSLRAQGREAEAAEAEARFRTAWKDADAGLRGTAAGR